MEWSRAFEYFKPHRLPEQASALAKTLLAATLTASLYPAIALAAGDAPTNSTAKLSLAGYGGGIDETRTALAALRGTTITQSVKEELFGRAVAYYATQLPSIKPEGVPNLIASINNLSSFVDGPTFSDKTKSNCQEKNDIPASDGVAWGLVIPKNRLYLNEGFQGNTATDELFVRYGIGVLSEAPALVGYVPGIQIPDKPFVSDKTFMIAQKGLIGVGIDEGVQKIRPFEPSKIPPEIRKRLEDIAATGCALYYRYPLHQAFSAAMVVDESSPLSLPGTIKFPQQDREEYLRSKTLVYTGNRTDILTLPYLASDTGGFYKTLGLFIAHSKGLANPDDPDVQMKAAEDNLNPLIAQFNDNETF